MHENFQTWKSGAPPGKETLISPTKGRHCLESTMLRFPFGVIWDSFPGGKIYIYMDDILEPTTPKPTMILLPIWTFSPPLKRYVVLPTLLIYCRLYALFMLYNVVQAKTLKHRQVSFIPNQASWNLTVRTGRTNARKIGEHTFPKNLIGFDS